MKELFELFALFFKMGAVTFGGGYAMLPILQEELQKKRGWVTEEELLDYYAIAQSTPGIIAVNVATFVGYKRRGVIGAIFTTFGIVAPSILIISLIASFIQNFDQLVWVQKALKGINVVVAVLLTTSIYGMAKKALKDSLCVVIALVSFIMVGFFDWKTVIFIVGSACIGIAVKKAKGELK